MTEDLPSYQETCQHVGHLFLTHRQQVEALAAKLRDLTAALARAERERDEALALLTPAKP